MRRSDACAGAATEATVRAVKQPQSTLNARHNHLSDRTARHNPLSVVPCVDWADDRRTHQPTIFAPSESRMGWTLWDTQDERD
jgi:hypothetical protein